MSRNPNDEFAAPDILSQVMGGIQGGLNRLEQGVNEAANRGRARAVGEYSQQVPAASSQPYQGPLWEYKVVYVNFRGQISSEGEQFTIGRGERRSGFVRKYMNQLGLQGWELTGIHQLGSTQNSYFIFKRLIGGNYPAFNQLPATTQQPVTSPQPTYNPPPSSATPRDKTRKQPIEIEVVEDE